MKIIISHDVDHVYSTDHIFRDLIYPKLWVRSAIQFLQRKIKFRTFIYRVLSIFEKRLNRIDEVMKMDILYGVNSVFFFGMSNGLGMSYRIKEAIPMIQKVNLHKFDVGVHGIEFDEFDGIVKEKHLFENVIGYKDFGIRTHYVRFNNSTFRKFSNAGYIFDTSQFNKKELDLAAPYKVGGMWEFPLHIMDGYIIPAGNLRKGIDNTIKAVKEAEEKGLPYLTILYHDYQYNEKTYPVEKAWYDWLLEYLSQNNYEFISYREAIAELEEKDA